MTAPVFHQRSIVDILIEGTSDLLKQKLIDEVYDSSVAGLVRPGKLQADPTEKKINILIHPGGRENPDIIGALSDESLYYEFGSKSSMFWRRRIEIELKMFFTSERQRSDSRIKANLVMSRAVHALMCQNVSRMPMDSFGERAYAVQVYKLYVEEGGGEGDYNWRGCIMVEYFTMKEFEIETV